jgi:hypothetical protein
MASVQVLSGERTIAESRTKSNRGNVRGCDRSFSFEKLTNGRPI